MQLTVRSLCLLIAVVLFVLYALSVDVKGVSFLGLGLAFFAGSFVVPETRLNR
jgi:hypothetical protein